PPSQPVAAAGCHQRLPAVHATRARSDRYRIGSGVLLQHRVGGEMSSSPLANRRSAGTVARARARRGPLSGDEMVAGLFAVVVLRFCYNLSAAVGQDGPAKIGAGRNIE